MSDKTKAELMRDIRHLKDELGTVKVLLRKSEEEGSRETARADKNFSEKSAAEFKHNQTEEKLKSMRSSLMMLIQFTGQNCELARPFTGPLF